MTVEDFSNAFGGTARIIYDFREGVLYISWLMNDAEYPEEIMGTVPVTDTENISEISDLAEWEVIKFSTPLLSISELAKHSKKHPIFSECEWIISCLETTKSYHSF